MSWPTRCALGIVAMIDAAQAATGSGAWVVDVLDGGGVDVGGRVVVDEGAEGLVVAGGGAGGAAHADTTPRSAPAMAALNAECRGRRCT
jgi:hypothetical protein